jgi:hypothetical protein
VLLTVQTLPACTVTTELEPQSGSVLLAPFLGFVPLKGITIAVSEDVEGVARFPLPEVTIDIHFS